MSVLIGAGAALAAVVICSLTSATLSPVGGALLGVAFGLTGASGARPGTGASGLRSAVARGLLAGGTAALVIALLQRR